MSSKGPLLKLSTDHDLDGFVQSFKVVNFNFIACFKGDVAM